MVADLAALTNGLNPCGIGMMITFLGYLLVFGQSKKDKYFLVKLGVVYITAVFVTYLFIGLLFMAWRFIFNGCGWRVSLSM